MTERDEVVDLADRLRAMTEFQFAIEWGALTGDERDEVMALLKGRIAHGEERLEGITENVRALKALLVLVMSNGGGTVGRPWLKAASPCGRSSRRSAARCPTRWRSRSRADAKPVDADAYAGRGRRENLETRRGSTAAGHCRGTARLPVCAL